MNRDDLNVSSVGTGRSALHVFYLKAYPSQLLHELGSFWICHGSGSFFSLVHLSLNGASEVILFRNAF